MKQQRPQRENTIITILAKNNGQTSMQIYKDSKLSNEKKMGRGALYLGLESLQEENVIKMDKDRKYWIQNEVKDKKLSGILKMDLMKADLNKYMKELKEHETPFEIGFVLLRTSMYTLSKLTLEQHSPQLTPIEKEEYQKLIEHCNMTIKRTFETLEEIDFKQTIALKKGLDITTTIPQFELKMESVSKKSHRTKATKIIKEIMRHYPDPNLKNIRLTS